MLFPRRKPEKTFWITNISDRNVSLSDLAISVPAMSSVNLLDKRHYGLTEEQVKKSAISGSIYKKGDYRIEKGMPALIAVRKVPPNIPNSQKPMPFCQDPLPDRGKSILEIKHEEYEELKIDEEISLGVDASTIENKEPIKEVISNNIPAK